MISSQYQCRFILKTSKWASHEVSDEAWAILMVVYVHQPGTNTTGERASDKLAFLAHIRGNR